MFSLFKTRDLYERGAFYRIEKKIREPKLWSFEVWPFSVKYCFYKAISIVIWGSFWLFLTHFWPFFQKKWFRCNKWCFLYENLWVLHTSAKKVGGNTDFGEKIWLFAPNSRKNQQIGSFLHNLGVEMPSYVKILGKWSNNFVPKGF